ncbi:MAG: hypothetical protein LUC93_11610 [Planctomycetaceae bacterium]|nr:hypothetical protein [Planctomycetaceae bacterium]
MSDKEFMPRMREQYKDNAIEVTKNVPAKRDLREEELRAKAEKLKEQESIHQDYRPAPVESADETAQDSGGVKCNPSPDCGPDCGCFASE